MIDESTNRVSRKCLREIRIKGTFLLFVNRYLPLFQALDVIREKAQAIISFAGRLPIQFMSVIYSNLVKMEVMMRR